MKPIYLRRARKAKKLTQAELAAKIQKPQSFIAKLETGAKADVTTTEAKALADALGLDDPMRLVFGPDPQEAKAS